MRRKQALAAALRAGGASSSSIRDVQVPLHIRLQEEYELLLAEQDAASKQDEIEKQEQIMNDLAQQWLKGKGKGDVEGKGSRGDGTEEGGAANWKEDLLNWETMGDDPPETVKESDEEDKEKGKEEEPCLCSSCTRARKTYNSYLKDKEEKGKGSGTTRGAGGDASDGTPRPKPSNKRWKMLVPSNFRRRSQPYNNNEHWIGRYDVVLQCEENLQGQYTRGFMPGHSAGKGFKVRR